jgi:hypothetical protein
MRISAIGHACVTHALFWNIGESGAFPTAFEPSRQRAEFGLKFGKPPEQPVVFGLDQATANCRDTSETGTVTRRCQARGCSAMFVTAKMDEMRCASCRGARRKVALAEHSYCGCAAAMCAGD